jgi:hypothetical protein
MVGLVLEKYKKYLFSLCMLKNQDHAQSSLITH